MREVFDFRNGPGSLNAATANRGRARFRNLSVPPPTGLEPLEDRCLLSVAPLNVALISDAVAQAQQVRAAAANGTIAIVYHADTMTTSGLVNLLASVSAAHGGAPIGHLAIVAHGSPGEIDLGKADDLSLATLPSQAAALEQLRSVLTSDAEWTYIRALWLLERAARPLLTSLPPKRGRLYSPAITRSAPCRGPIFI